MEETPKHPVLSPKHPSRRSTSRAPSSQCKMCGSNHWNNEYPERPTVSENDKGAAGRQFTPPPIILWYFRDNFRFTTIIRYYLQEGYRQTPSWKSISLFDSFDKWTIGIWTDVINFISRRFIRHFFFRELTDKWRDGSSLMQKVFGRTKTICRGRMGVPSYNLSNRYV